jgi:sugar/nucleoside kinase (ribokinase family)
MTSGIARYDVMVAGHLCIDVIPKFSQTSACSSMCELIRPGKLVQMKEATLSTGGPVSNTGICLSKLGKRVSFCACVGDDDFGKLTLDRLNRTGCADGITIRKGVGSSYTIVIAPPGFDRVFLHNPGANDTFGSADLNDELVAQCRHFHFGYPPLMKNIYRNDGEELAGIFRSARKAGATTSLDMALPGSSWVK